MAICIQWQDAKNTNIHATAPLVFLQISRYIALTMGTVLEKQRCVHTLHRNTQLLRYCNFKFLGL